MNKERSLKLMIKYCHELKHLLEISENKRSIQENESQISIKDATDLSDRLIEEINTLSIERTDDALTLFTDNGWKEIRSTSIRFERVRVRNLMSGKEYLENIKYGFRNRKKCDCCSRQWIKIDSNVHSIVTSRGERVVCDLCIKHLETIKVI